MARTSLPVVDCLTLAMFPQFRFAVSWAAAFASALGLAAAAEPLHHELIQHPSDPAKKIELYWIAPAEETPSPAILYVHGYQSPANRPGARAYVDNSTLARAAEIGMVAAAVSQPGFGESDGPADFCGPFSQGAVEAAIATLRKNPRVIPERVVLCGYSRGAITASVVATRDSDLAGLVLGGGSYDMERALAGMEDTPNNVNLKRNYQQEAGTSRQAHLERSALLASESIRVPTLILHGELDPTSPVDQARELAARIRETGTPVELIVFPGVPHSISPRATKRGNGAVSASVCTEKVTQGMSEVQQTDASRTAIGRNGISRPSVIRSDRSTDRLLSAVNRCGGFLTVMTGGPGGTGAQSALFSGLGSRHPRHRHHHRPTHRDARRSRAFRSDCGDLRKSMSLCRQSSYSHRTCQTNHRRGARSSPTTDTYT